MDISCPKYKKIKNFKKLDSKSFFWYFSLMNEIKKKKSGIRKVFNKYKETWFLHFDTIHSEIWSDENVHFLIFLILKFLASNSCNSEPWS